MEKSKAAIELEAIAEGLKTFVRESISNIDSNPVIGMMIRDHISELQLFYSNQYLSAKIHNLISEKYNEGGPPDPIDEGSAE